MATDDLTLQGIADLQEAQSDLAAAVARLEARPTLDDQTIARLVSEQVAQLLRPVPIVTRRRAWWRTPLYCTLAVLLAVVSTWELLAWQTRAAQASVVQSPAKASAQKRGK